MHTHSINQALNHYISDEILEVYLKEEWSSRCKGYRESIREFIFTNICSTPRVKDLTQVPVIEDGAISISHSKRCGGFLWARGPKKYVGFDIEEQSRVTHEHSKKISTHPQESLLAPSPSALWCAKEAAYKALLGSGMQPVVHKDIEIGDWESENSDTFQCRIKKIAGQNPGPIFGNARGVVVMFDDQIAAVFVARGE